MTNDNARDKLSSEEETERLDSSYLEHFIYQLEQAETLDTMDQKTQELWSLINGLEDYLQKGDSLE
ncbi:hypothetical protein ACN08Z_02160 [Rothia sp. P7181]|uniref:hypothetical protein n=1 Tax=unclassified Rothia (in: high G+C Gram-positive bacteria) TaxID=2689056 RepID=UPI003AE067DA